jgi:hypothetical protein
MKRSRWWMIAAFSGVFPAGPASAADPAADAVLSRAAKAVGGGDKLSKADAFFWNAKCRLTFNGTEAYFRSKVSTEGLDHLRRDVSYSQYQLTVVVNGEKGWRRLKNKTHEMAAVAVASETHSIYLMAVAINPLLLRGSEFTYRSAAEENVGGRAASVLRVTGPGGKDFKMYFDKATGLPVKQIARVSDLQGKPYVLESTFAEYKDFGGTKKATRITTKSDDSLVQAFELTDFKVLDKVDPQTFAEPKDFMPDRPGHVVAKAAAQ